jgi:hypothetical protein
MPEPITVTVCDACGSDVCSEVRRLGGFCRGKSTAQAPACRHRSDHDGRQCLRPERVHSSGWSHAFVGESQRKPEPIYGQWFNVADVPIPNDPDAWIVTARQVTDPQFATRRYTLFTTPHKIAHRTRAEFETEAWMRIPPPPWLAKEGR